MTKYLNVFKDRAYGFYITMVAVNGLTNKQSEKIT